MAYGIRDADGPRSDAARPPRRLTLRTGTRGLVPGLWLTPAASALAPLGGSQGRFGEKRPTARLRAA